MRTCGLALILSALLTSLPAAPAAADDFGTLVEWMTGSFSSAAHAADDTNFYDIRLEMARIWPERTDGAWLYVEQAAAWALEKPYRQRVYHVQDAGDGAYTSTVYALPDPAAAIGAFGVEAMDTALTTDGFEMLDGQDAELTWTAGPDPAACVRLVINGFNDVHGAPLSDIIECETADTGSLIIPRSFVEEFPHGETPDVTEGYDWPHAELTRYTQNIVGTDGGQAKLVIRSTTYFQPSHPE